MEKNPQLDWAVAKIIKEARGKAGMTQGQLAGFSGLSETYISFIEHANTKISLTALTQLAAVFSMSTNELVKRIEEELAKGSQPPEKKTGRPRKK